MLVMLQLNQPSLGNDNWESRVVCGEVTPKQRMGELACLGIRVCVRMLGYKQENSIRSLASMLCTEHSCY